jgi:hypothetical protein
VDTLQQLRSDLKLPAQCHSLRDGCIHKLPQLTGNSTLGIPGAALGYCQALFNYEGSPEKHTQKVKEYLAQIDAPWCESHELFWGFRESETPANFLHEGMTPLLGTGRIPILITGLNPNKDEQIISEILNSEPLIFENETALLRFVIDDLQGIKIASKIIDNLVQHAHQTKQMPKLWPLLQGSLSEEEWLLLKEELGSNWKYANIAANPYTLDSIPEFCKTQLTVAQVVVGHADDIDSAGTITLSKGMKIGGAEPGDSYHLKTYFGELNKLYDVPTLIVLGPSLPSWTIFTQLDHLYPAGP